MNDPHVKSLRYSVHTPDRVSFQGAPPLSVEIDGFRLLLEDDILIVEPDCHFASEQEARAVLDDILASWEIDVAMNYGEREIKFVFESSEIIDREPPPPGSPLVVQVKAAIVVTSAVGATVSVTRGKFPPPPKLFRITPDTETLWHRFERYKNGHEPLPAMAYFCITVLEGIFGDRMEAARSCNISKTVLKTLAKLSTEKGDTVSARKYPRKSSPVPHSAAEIAWMEAALKAIVRRLGEINQMTTLPQISMKDLPRLE